MDRTEKTKRLFDHRFSWQIFTYRLNRKNPKDSLITDLPSSNTHQKTEKRLNAPLHSPTSSSAASNPTQNKIKPKLGKPILRTHLARICPQFAARRQLQPLYTRSTQIILKSFETITPNNRSKREKIFHTKQLKAGGDWSYLRVDSSGGCRHWRRCQEPPPPGSCCCWGRIQEPTPRGSWSRRLPPPPPWQAAPCFSSGGSRGGVGAGEMRVVDRWGGGVLAVGEKGTGRKRRRSIYGSSPQGMGLPRGGDRPNYEIPKE